MPTLQNHMLEYHRQLKRGAIQSAYKGLMEYMASLKSYFKESHPEYTVSGSLYFGYMDMTYFAIVPESLRGRGLKVALVFLHEAFRFEVWLAGANRQVQSKYWQLIKGSGWQNYRLVSPAPGIDAILEHILVEAPDFSDLPALTAQIEQETLVFIRDVEGFLADHA